MEKNKKKNKNKNNRALVQTAAAYLIYILGAAVSVVEQLSTNQKVGRWFDLWPLQSMCQSVLR